MTPQHQVQRLIEREADLRSAYRQGDPGAELLADCVRRQRLELEIDIERAELDPVDPRQETFF